MFNRSSACTFVLCCNMSNKTKNKTLHSHNKQANSPATKGPNVIWAQGLCLAYLCISRAWQYPSRTGIWQIFCWMTKWIWRSLQPTQVEFRHLNELSRTSRSVWVPADGVTSPSALPQWTWKGFQTRALLETWNLVSSTNFILLSHLPKWQFSMSSGFPALSTFTTYHPSLPTSLQCSFLWWTNPYLLHIVCWPWLNMVLSLGRHLLCSLWRGGCSFSHILLRGGSP